MVSLSLTPSRPKKALPAPSALFDPAASSSRFSPSPVDDSIMDSSEPFTSYHIIHVHLPPINSRSPSGPAPKSQRRYQESSGVQHYNFPSPLEYDSDRDNLDVGPSRTNGALPLADAEHAVSACYHPESHILARQIANGRVIELRSMVPDLPVSAASMPTSSLIIRLTVPGKLRPFASGSQAIYAHPLTGDLTLFLVDTANKLYKLDFESPNRRLQSGEDSIWDFDEDKMICEPIPFGIAGDADDSEMIWEVLDERSLVLGTKDGCVACSWRDSAFSYSPLQAPSRSFLFFSSSARASQVTGLATYYPPDVEDTSAFLYSITADRKLRAWSLVNQSHAWTVEDILAGITINQPMASRTSKSSSNALVIRGADGTPNRDIPISAYLNDTVLRNTQLRSISAPDGSGHFLVVFIPTKRSVDSGGIFRIYKAEAEGTKIVDFYSPGFFTGSSETRGAELTGFHIEILPGLQSVLEGRNDSPSASSDTVWRLWTAWNIGGRSFVEWANVSPIFSPNAPTASEGTSQKPWHSVKPTSVRPVDSTYFDSVISINDYSGSDVFDDIREVFLDHVLSPGRYSAHSIQASLEDYVDAVPEDLSQELDIEGVTNVRDQLRAAIGCTIDEDFDHDDEQAVSHVRQAYKMDWIGFLSRLQAADRQSRCPLSLQTFEVSRYGQTLIVITREGVDVIFENDDLQILHDFAEASTQPNEAESLRQETNIFLGLSLGSVAALHPALGSRSARRRLVESMAALESLPRAFGDDVLDAISQVAEDFVSGTDTDDLSPSETMAAVYAHLSARDVVDGAHIASTLEEHNVDVDAIKELLPFVTGNEHPAESVPTCSYLGYAIRLARSRYAIETRRDVVMKTLLLCAILANRVEDDSAEGGTDKVASLIDISALTLNAFRSIAAVNWLLSQPAITEQARLHPEQDMGMEIEFSSLALAARNASFDETSYSLAHTILAKERIVPNDLLALLIQPERWYCDLKELSPTKQDIRLAHQIFNAGYPKLAGIFASSFYPDAPGIAFLYGLSSLATGQWDTAAKAFSHVAASRSQSPEVGTNDDGILELLPPQVSAGGLPAFYRFISSKFEECGAVEQMVKFSQLALQDSEAEDPANEEVFARLFRTFTQTNRFEEAFHVLIRNPFNQHSKAEIGKDRPLGNLIHAMCVADAIPRLLSLPFSGMDHLVESELTFKARNADPLATPNYYRVLYAWYISKADYRNAGIVMYQQGRRLLSARRSSDPNWDFIQEAAKSYLASIQAFSLIDPVNAWVVLPKQIGEASISRPSLSTYVPESMMMNGSKAVEIVTIADIRKEYNLLMSRLKVSQHCEDELDPEIALSADDCVDFFSRYGLFDDALMTAVSLGADLAPVFRHLTRRAVELERFGDMDDEMDTGAWLAVSPISATWRGSRSERAYRYLEVVLKRHAGRKVEHCYFETVFGELMDCAPTREIPEWLSRELLRRRPELLLSRLLEFNRIEDVANLIQSLLTNISTNATRNVRDGFVPPAYTPYNVIDQFLARGSEDEKWKDCVESVRAAVDRHIQLLESMSRR